MAAPVVFLLLSLLVCVAGETEELQRHLSALALLAKTECNQPEALKKQEDLCEFFQQTLLETVTQSLEEFLPLFLVSETEYVDRSQTKEFAKIMHENIRLSVTLLVELIPKQKYLKDSDKSQLMEKLLIQQLFEAYFLQLFEQDAIRKRGRSGAAFDVSQRLKDNRNLVQEFKQVYKSEIQKQAIDQGLIKPDNDTICDTNPKEPRKGGRPVKARKFMPKDGVKQAKVLSQQSPEDVAKLMSENDKKRAKRQIDQHNEL